MSVTDTNDTHSSLVERSLGATTAAAALAGGLSGGVRRAFAAGGASGVSMELPDEAYTTLGGDMKSCKILNGKAKRRAFDRSAPSVRAVL